MNFNSYTTMNSMVEELNKELDRKIDLSLLESLNELISRGLLVVEKTQPVLIHSSDTNKIEIKTVVRLLLKDQEYIKKLETENAGLRSKLLAITTAIQDIKQ